MRWEMNKPIKLIGYFLQIYGGLILILWFVFMGTEKIFGGIIVAIIGFAILLWGGLVIRSGEEEK